VNLKHQKERFDKTNMPVKKILTNSKKTALLNNAIPPTKQDVNKLAERWIEILLDQMQSSKNCNLSRAISVKPSDN